MIHVMDQSLSGHKIGFVGLGNMGAPMAQHLQDAGAEVVVWNRSDGPAEAAVARGMSRAKSLPDLAREIGDGVIGLNLTNTDVVEAVVFGPGGLAERPAEWSVHAPAQRLLPGHRRQGGRIVAGREYE